MCRDELPSYNIVLEITVIVQIEHVSQTLLQ